MIKVLIVDDDQRERIVLRYVLEQLNDVEIVGEAVHGLEALLLCQEKKVDLVFLDITMPEMGGMETAVKLKSLKDPPLFAFVTAKREMAVEAYELGALDYIVKPIEQNRIRKTIDRAKYQIAHKDVINELVRNRLKERIDFMLERYKDHEVYANKLPIREKGKITLIPQGDIIYCESQGRKAYIFTKKQAYLSNYTLGELEEKLDGAYFFRAHQAFIVNLNYVKEIVSFGEGSYVLKLEDSDKNIILSRARAKILRQRMGIQ
ncbi:LytTR family DNA-binding domain-containing protein [Thermosyntropha sp.]|uniref:LytR/AlgR family response regulator transcription factor n=1 Tax=Thermosyntropha sp. TaxID=2740820 RepID=UPI0025EB11C3|nr:LytTR family DNA-binding domain-containing protein [Thermosyntropha sp.]MBO8159848.1 response regulator transcription factor [Thermosyntropha sp.]